VLLDSSSDCTSARADFGSDVSGAAVVEDVLLSQPLDIDVNGDDFMGEATQVETAPLYVLFDDRATTSETGSGELDYLKITTP
jgi:hypothetical protein